MITIINDQLEKIDLLDTLFGSLSVDQLRELTEQECVASKLRGDNFNPGILRTLVQENEIHNSEIMILKNDINVLRYNLQLLTKLMLKPYDYNSQSDVQILKSSLGIY